MTNIMHKLSRRAALLALGATCVLAAACSDFLVAENPGAIEETAVTDPLYIGILANGPIFAFQSSWDDVTYWNAQLTDEIYNRDVFIEEGQIDRRDLYSDMTYITAFMYNPMQRSRFVAEDAARRLITLLPDSAGRFLPIARALAYAGYSYIALGEMNCEVPIDLSVPKTPDEIFEDAIRKFDSAFAIATAARTFYQGLTPVNAAGVAAADSLRGLALVGAARAALQKNEKTRAVTYASQVAAGFNFVEWYSDNTAAQRHRVYDRLQLNSSGWMVNTPFLAKTGDPRLPRLTTGATAGKPLSPPSYSTFNNTVAGAIFAAAMNVRIASYLEAQYILAEADGNTLSTQTFVNTRRAAGSQGPIALAAGDPGILAELREQRSRDFYLDNHRLGDLRRYKRFDGIDLFPTGAYPTSTSGQTYLAAVCWPLPSSEINGNPNIPKGP